MTKRWLLASVILVVANYAFANVGIFSGSGQTLKLMSSPNVQMVSERVEMFPEPEAIIVQGVKVPNDVVRFEGEYELKNLTDDTLNIQVGFPLNSDYVTDGNYHREHNDRDVSDRDYVREYGFVVKDQEQTYTTTYSAEDQRDHYHGLFAWKMRFAPREEKIVRVHYRLSVSITAAETYRCDRDYYNASARDTCARLRDLAESLKCERFCEGIDEYFDYVTSTGKSWARTIGHAEFIVHCSVFEKYLNKRGVMDSAVQRMSMENSKKNPPWLRANTGSTFFFNQVFVSRRISPGGWQEKNGDIAWTFDNYLPDSSLRVEYFLTQFPRTVGGLDSLIQTVYGKNPKKEQLEVVRQMIGAYFGLIPEDHRVSELAEGQFWYSPRQNLKVGDLPTDQLALMLHLDTLMSK